MIRNAETTQKPRQARRLSPAHIFSLGFFAIILCGALLLMLPIATNDGSVTPFPDTLFTAVSATCVTGLIVVDTGIHWSLFGQTVILLMIQIGGLGFMSFALLLLGALGRQVSPRVKSLAAQAFGIESMSETKQIVRRVFIGTMLIEGIGAILLCLRTVPMLGVGRGIYTGIFLSVSAFCNAGFDPLGGHVTSAFSSLVELETDPLLLTVLGMLILLGGAGFLVWNDIWEWLLHRRRMCMYAKFVLSVTLTSLFISTVLLAVFEWNNPDTVAAMEPWEKLLHAWFQAVTPRTAGFDAIGQAAMTDTAKTLSMIIMFIGGASGSTAGGAKVSTVGVMLAAVWATLRGKRDIQVMRRTIPHDAVRQAMCILFFILFSVFLFAFFIAAYDGVTMEEALYECFSAFCTVGLTLGITPGLSLVSRMMLAFAMYLGRVGILTLSYVLLHRDKSEDAIRYPEAKILLG